eukprot:c31683_g1_i1.p1 GENE.c31683_g1_i1~~c31683_g1_i1.p1  ORF type:complete len:269 (-),score=11.63 c31683_g1_i1:166-972(-)
MLKTISITSRSRNLPLKLFQRSCKCLSILTSKSSLLMDVKFSGTDLLLLEDVKSNHFHERSFDYCYFHVFEGDKQFVRDLEWRYLNRLVGTFSLEIQGKRLWTPFLVDTGAPYTYISKRIAKEKFGVQEIDEVNNSISVRLGNKSLFASFAPEEDRRNLSDLNILGMDVYEKNVEFKEQLKMALSSFKQPDSPDIFTEFQDDSTIKEALLVLQNEFKWKAQDVDNVVKVLEKEGCNSVKALRMIRRNTIDSFELPLVFKDVILRIGGK